MKTYKISEVLYWTIAGISIYKFISLWGYDQTRAYYFIGFAVLSILWHFLDDILEKSITKEPEL